MKKPLSVLAVLLTTILVLGVGCDDDDETAATVQVSDEEYIEQVGNKWAPLFAKGGACRYQVQPVCEEFLHRRPSGFQKSFANATVRWVVVEDSDAAGSSVNAVAEFSNRELVEFDLSEADVIEGEEPLRGPGDEWLISDLLSDEEQVEWVGNEWAPLFAKDLPAACRYMHAQPSCEEFFGRVGEPPEVRDPSGFQKSFANATVERVEIKGQKAGAEFSNREVVVFIQETHGPPHRPERFLARWLLVP